MKIFFPVKKIALSDFIEIFIELKIYFHAYILYHFLPFRVSLAHTRLNLKQGFSGKEEIIFISSVFPKKFQK